ncbi:hypothetical protein shim_34770 [Shimia sp. SK013]|uniref:hypothetical protein n=1 Tax=Shimia sp. SK013 TaxID=1389006 RepID=UPI0006B54A84|nr:hypothetical protein [Shimia sp. SK013]KPA20487.1 hypothetical protein shim_34770 [Shimia sp. SK013]
MKRVLAYLPTVLALALCIVLAPVLAVATGPVDVSEPVVVVAGPGVDLIQIIEKSGGAVIGLENAPLGALGYSDDPKFAENLRANGAWAVWDGRTIAELCGVKT